MALASEIISGPLQVWVALRSRGTGCRRDARRGRWTRIDSGWG